MEQKRRRENKIKTASNHTLFIDYDAYYEIFSDFHHWLYDYFALHKSHSVFVKCGEKESCVTFGKLMYAVEESEWVEV